LNSRSTDIDGLNAALDGYLAALDCPEALRAAMSYSVGAGGKRLRPALLIAASGGDPDAVPFACAVELIHTYSLIHDDLPAMDDDDLRRGKPANHKIFGEWAAILAGDGLLNLAYEVMIGFCAGRLEPRFLAAADEIARAAGAGGMVGGQYADMESERVVADLSRVLYIDARKTGALITAAIAAGAIVSGAVGEALDRFRKLGRKLGLAFQIKDDLLNAAGDPAKLGKPVGTDGAAGKATYVSLAGEKQAAADYERLSRDIIEMIDFLPEGHALRDVVGRALFREH
jgi:geranylgeranyl diphosphate synthase type II